MNTTAVEGLSVSWCDFNVINNISLDQFIILYILYTSSKTNKIFIELLFFFAIFRSRMKRTHK
jgi:hypothetical protein